MQFLPQLNDARVVELRPETQRPVVSDDPISAWWELESARFTTRFPTRCQLNQERINQAYQFANVLTVLLRGSECQFRCLMCDLWKSTHRGPTPAGELPRQLRYALQTQAVSGNALALDSVNRKDPWHATACERWLKLYNASNFFANYNVPRQDLAELAELSSGFDRVVVENHPRLLGDNIGEFRDALSGRLEVAMGLETAHPELLRRLNKKMHLGDFSNACGWLLERDVDIRTFVLLRPPGLNEQDGIHWCHKSVQFAEQCGVRHISIVPVRGGNGALEHLNAQGLFTPPLASSLEQVMVDLLPTARSVLTADLWDWNRLRGLCDECREPRRAVMERANLTQTLAIEDVVGCMACETREHHASR